jgi:iron-sulfur cluster repair protein YtfE (RIC family)
MIYRLLYKMLHDAPEVANVVGARIFAEHAPENTIGACLVLNVISGTINSHLQNESDVAQPMVQVDCYDETPLKAERLYQRVRNLLSGWQPSSIDVLSWEGTDASVRVQAINLIRPGMSIEPPADASDRWKYRYSADFEVFHTQDVPTHV